MTGKQPIQPTGSEADQAEDPAFTEDPLPSDHYLISMQQISHNFTPPPGSVPAHSGKLLSWAPECPAAVNTATLRCSGTMDLCKTQRKERKKTQNKQALSSDVHACMSVEE